MRFARGAEGGVGWHGSGCESIRIESSCIFNEDLKFQPDYFGVNVLGTFVSCCILLSQVPSTDVGCIVLHSILGCASDMSPNKPLAFDEALLRWDAVVKVRGQVLFVRDAEVAVAAHGKWNATSMYTRRELNVRMCNEIELGFQYKSLRALLMHSFVNKRCASAMGLIETITSWRACSRLRWRTMRTALAKHIREDAIRKFHVYWWWKMRQGLVGRAATAKAAAAAAPPPPPDHPQ